MEQIAIFETITLNNVRNKTGHYILTQLQNLKLLFWLEKLSSHS